MTATLKMIRIKQSFQLVFCLGESETVLLIKKMVKIFTAIKNYFLVDYLRTIFPITSYFITSLARQSYSTKRAQGQFLNLRKQFLQYFLNGKIFVKYLKQPLLTRRVRQELVRNTKMISDSNTQSLKLLILN
jgi:hypothetical protein